MATELIGKTRPASILIGDVNVPAEPSRQREQLAIKAYEIYCARGGEHGHDLDDWIEAERQLRMESADGSKQAGTAQQA
ncbi:MAG: DUF2934 domain-containing protein [Chloroflexi bacterium]|nr:DUF2934 domain-containing protein [Chloroflexota bacterium]